MEKGIKMIVDLTVKNFLSFKDEQLFSLYVDNSPNNEKPLHHNQNFSSSEDNKYNTLRAAVIFGANASGKSNLLKAFKVLRFLIVDSGRLQEGESIALR